MIYTCKHLLKAIIQNNTLQNLNHFNGNFGYLYSYIFLVKLLRMYIHRTFAYASDVVYVLNTSSCLEVKERDRALNIFRKRILQTSCNIFCMYNTFGGSYNCLYTYRLKIQKLLVHFVKTKYLTYPFFFFSKFS